MQKEEPVYSEIEINKEKGKIRVLNNNSLLTYCLLSTEPGRKIIYPPQQLTNPCALEFTIQKCEGIEMEKQGYCAVGFSEGLETVQHLITKKPTNSVSQKVLYISKINADFRPLTTTYFSDPDNRYKFNLSILPPNDINAEEIQWLLEKFMVLYGPVEKVDVKRNTLILLYSVDVEVKQNFMVRGFRSEAANSFILTYWAITNHRTLYTYEPIKLIQLPMKQKIKNYLIQADWLIISTGSQVIFLHLYKPSQLFETLNNVNIHSICLMEDNKVILFDYKFHLVYQLFSFKNPILLGRIKTKKLVAHTVAFKKKIALFGGINYSPMLNQPTKQKQIHVVQSYSPTSLTNKSLLADKKLYICKKHEGTGIKNLQYLQKQNLFLCTCGQSLYLFHLDSSSMIASVDLTTPISKLYQMDYPINIVNCLVKAKAEKLLIRIGFQQYAEIVGTEVSRAEGFGDVRDFAGEGKDICCTDGTSIVVYNQKNRVIYIAENQDERVRKIAMRGGYLSFLLCKQSIMEAYFLEL